MYVATQTRGTSLGIRNVKRIPKMINILKCLPLICQERFRDSILPRFYPFSWTQKDILIQSETGFIIYFFLRNKHYVSVFWGQWSWHGHFDNLSPRSEKVTCDDALSNHYLLLERSLLRATRLASCLLDSLMTILWSLVSPSVTDFLDSLRESEFPLLESLSDLCWRWSSFGMWGMVSRPESFFESLKTPLFLSGL